MINADRSYFKIADETEPLSKEDQLKQWMKFKTALDILEEFYHSNYAVRRICKLDRNFKYFNRQLIDLFFEQEKDSRKLIDVRRGIKAKDALIFTNMRLIIARAKVFHREGMDLKYLINEGIIGAIRSLIKFVPTTCDKVSKATQLSLFATDEEIKEQETIREYKVSSYMKTWLDCYMRLAVTTHINLINTPASKDTLPFTYVEFSPTRATEDYEISLEPEIDLYALVKSNPEDLEVLECSVMELALDKGVTVSEAREIKAKVANELRSYLSV